MGSYCEIPFFGCLERTDAGGTKPVQESAGLGDPTASVTRDLKRIQRERPSHGVNPPAFRAIIAALHSAYGKPDQTCFLPVSPIGGYQRAAQEIWVRGADAISAIYRDTTLQAFEGCVFGITSGPCGLPGQLLVRLSPADGITAPDPCALAQHHSCRPT